MDFHFSGWQKKDHIYTSSTIKSGNGKECPDNVFQRQK